MTDDGSNRQSSDIEEIRQLLKRLEEAAEQDALIAPEAPRRALPGYGGDGHVAPPSELRHPPRPVAVSDPRRELATLKPVEIGFRQLDRPLFDPPAIPIEEFDELPRRYGALAAGIGFAGLAAIGGLWYATIAHVPHVSPLALSGKEKLAQLFNTAADELSDVAEWLKGDGETSRRNGGGGEAGASKEARRAAVAAVAVPVTRETSNAAQISGHGDQAPSGAAEGAPAAGQQEPVASVAMVQPLTKDPGDSGADRVGGDAVDGGGAGGEKVALLDGEKGGKDAGAPSGDAPPAADPPAGERDFGNSEDPLPPSFDSNAEPPALHDQLMAVSEIILTKGKPVPLGLDLLNGDTGEAFLLIVRGLPHGVRLSKGSPIGNDSWFMPAVKLDEVAVIAGGEIAGDFKLHLELVTVDGRIVSLAETQVAVAR